jgi:lysophospholipase L1-like esterase
MRVGLTLSFISLAILELAARALIFVMPALGDPWSGRIGATMNGELVRQMEAEIPAIARRQELYVPDRRLFWRLASDVNLQVENQLFETRGAPVVWTIRTNDIGFRGPRIPDDVSGLRILTLGDSCTFGFRVAEEAAYPARLRDACTSRDRQAVVLNAGVPGYTSHQGRLLLESLVDTYHPNVVTIAFGTNDRESDPLSDAERSAWLDTFIGRLTYESARSGVYRALSALLVRPPSPAAAARRVRVDVAAFRENVNAMIARARHASARVVLIDLVFVGPIYLETLQSLAAQWNVPLMDGRAILDSAYAAIESGTAYQNEAKAWRRFYVENILSIRPVYFDRTFYERKYATEREQQQFITMMADPIHPSAIGHHAVSDALAPVVCPPEHDQRP